MQIKWQKQKSIRKNYKHQKSDHTETINHYWHFRISFKHDKSLSQFGFLFFSSFFSLSSILVQLFGMYSSSSNYFLQINLVIKQVLLYFIGLLLIIIYSYYFSLLLLIITLVRFYLIMPYEDYLLYITKY